MKFYRFKEQVIEQTYMANLQENVDGVWKPVKPYTIKLEDLRTIGTDDEWDYRLSGVQQITEIFAASPVEKDEPDDTKRTFYDKCRGFFGAE